MADVIPKLEEVGKVYRLKFADETNFCEALKERGYTVEEETSYAYGRIRNAQGTIVGRIEESLCALKISTIVETPEGRTLDKVLAEWAPEKKGE